MTSKIILGGVSALIVPLALALCGCEREPPVGAAVPAITVAVSQPIEREVIDYGEYTGRTAAVKAVEVRARVSGYAVKVPVLLGLAAEDGFPHEGTIDFVDNQVDPTTSTLRLRGLSPNGAQIHR